MVVIDQNETATQAIAEDLDVQVILCSGSSPATLREADIRDTDMLLAVTDSDEINLVACLVAKSLGAANTITRIGKASYYPLVATIGIEKVVSSILQDVRQGNVISDISIFGERGEFIEAITLCAGLFLFLTSKGSKDVNHINQREGMAVVALGWCMLLGRLEIYTVIILFVPEFWK